MKNIKIPFFILGVGILSLIATVIASGIEYRIAEGRGDFDLTASTGIMICYNISFAIILFGILFLLCSLIILIIRWLQQKKHST